jgi:hypothetical protein
MPKMAPAATSSTRHLSHCLSDRFTLAETGVPDPLIFNISPAVGSEYFIYFSINALAFPDVYMKK